MLPCVCSVIVHGDSRLCHWCSCHILTSSVIYYWTNARQHRIFFFYITTEQNTTDKAAFFSSKSFNITRKSAFAHFGEHGKAIWRNLLSVQNEAISLVAMHSKELWLAQENHATVKRDSSVTPRGQNWTAKSTNLKEKARKVESVFDIIAALWA